MNILLAALLLLAQSTPLTDLTITGSETAELTSSDANACYVADNNALSAQLTDAASSLIVSFTVLATPGDHPASNQLTALTLDGPSDDPFVNWSASGGTVSLDDLAARVPVEGGDQAVQASTAGVRGHIEADLTSRRGAFHIAGAFACHSAG
jgi:hypothetical protein